tara:strand:- start:56 stop:1081 length:1026 start_codon:yes stop_codon:yes gene_type:complete
MSKIKLSEFDASSSDENTEVKSDIDENNQPFQRLSVWSTHPITKQKIRWEWNKTDSSEIISYTDNEPYVEEDDIDYYQALFQANKYRSYLTDNTLIPATSEDNASLSPAVPKNPNTYDEVYVNKKLIRVDYNIGLHQADPLLAEIETVFGAEQDWDRNRFNIIGTYIEHDDAPLRPPYTDVKTYSWYDVFTEVPEDRLNTFKVSSVGYTYKTWHSIKYNTVSGKKQLKLVIADNDYTSNYQEHPDTFIPRPDVPVYADGTFFFAKIFNEDGTEADEYDVFFTTTTDIMKKFCAKKELSFPVPESREDDFIWIYGLVYDKNTLAIKQVKGYVRYAVNEGEWL